MIFKDGFQCQRLIRVFVWASESLHIKASASKRNKNEKYNLKLYKKLFQIIFPQKLSHHHLSRTHMVGRQEMVELDLKWRTGR